MILLFILYVYFVIETERHSTYLHIHLNVTLTCMDWIRMFANVKKVFTYFLIKKNFAVCIWALFGITDIMYGNGRIIHFDIA